MAKKLKAGIIGCGRFAGAGHAVYYRLHPDSELVAVCDSDESKAGFVLLLRAGFHYGWGRGSFVIY